ncbi:MAG: hypothetical protein ACI4M3_05625 [Acutalibacteraceae bacterium]
MKKSKILAFVVAATLAVSAIPTASAVVSPQNIDLSQSYNYGFGVGSWMKGNYVLGTSSWQSDAAVRTQNNIALGMYGKSIAYIQTEIDNSYRSCSVYKSKNYDGWVDTGYVTGKLNGTVQDDIAKSTRHTCVRYIVGFENAATQTIDQKFV